MLAAAFAHARPRDLVCRTPLSFQAFPTHCGIMGIMPHRGEEGWKMARYGNAHAWGRTRAEGTRIAGSVAEGSARPMVPVS